MLARVLFAPDAPLGDKLLGVAILAVFAAFFFVPFLSLAEYSKRTKEIDRQRQGFEPVMNPIQQAGTFDPREDLKQ